MSDGMNRISAGYLLWCETDPCEQCKDDGDQTMNGPRWKQMGKGGPPSPSWYVPNTLMLLTWCLVAWTTWWFFGDSRTVIAAVILTFYPIVYLGYLLERQFQRRRRRKQG